MAQELNGWDTEAMNAAVDGVRQNENAGRLTWRGRVHWDGGFGLDVRTREVEQLGQGLELHFTLRGDHPPELLGHNTGPTAIETCLAALGSCMAGTFAAQATARGVKLKGLEIDVEGDINLNDFFGIKTVKPGLSAIKLEFRVDSDAQPSVLHEILEAARARSPIFDTVSRPRTIDTTVTKLQAEPTAHDR